MAQMTLLTSLGHFSFTTITISSVSRTNLVARVSQQTVK